MWNPTIPQDKKFSTVIAKCSSQSEKQTLVDFCRRSMIRGTSHPPAENIINSTAGEGRMEFGRLKIEEAEIGD